MSIVFHAESYLSLSPNLHPPPSPLSLLRHPPSSTSTCSSSSSSFFISYPSLPPPCTYRSFESLRPISVRHGTSVSTSSLSSSPLSLLLLPPFLWIQRAATNYSRSSCPCRF
ncbi:hypothetical protein ANTPLA_LOCUS120 [Anthophora plagiata]